MTASIEGGSGEIQFSITFDEKTGAIQFHCQTQQIQFQEWDDFSDWVNSIHDIVGVVDTSVVASLSTQIRGLTDLDGIALADEWEKQIRDSQKMGKEEDEHDYE